MTLTEKGWKQQKYKRGKNSTGLGEWALAGTRKGEMTAMSLGLSQGHRNAGHTKYSERHSAFQLVKPDNVTFPQRSHLRSSLALAP